MITIEINQVKKGKKIGDGSFGSVFIGEIEEGKQKGIQALKEQFKISDHEKMILKALKDKQFQHLIKVIAFEEQEDRIFTLMELGEIINFSNLLDKRTICLQMAKGVSELHKLGFFHRDLKPNNFVIGLDNKIKLIDFGTTKTIQYTSHTQNEGTLSYMAPEVSITDDYDSSVDIWSLGIIFYELLTNSTFFEKGKSEYEICYERVQISQKQINLQIDAQKSLEQWQKALLKKMIVQKLENDNLLNHSIKRINIDEVINEFEQSKNFQQTQQKVYQQKNDLDNETQFQNSKWTDLRINQLHKLEIHSQWISSLCFSPDGTTLASGSGDNIINLWDVKTAKVKSKLEGHRDWVTSLCFSPDGTTLASGSGDNTIRLWDVKTEKLNQELSGHRYDVNSICFSPDGSTLASGSDDKSISLWDVKTGKEKYKIQGHSEGVLSVCFSPDGTTLASSSYDKSIRLWDILTGQQKGKLDGHEGTVYSVRFSPDGSTLASGSEDESIRLWDVQKQQEIQKLIGQNGIIFCLCFSSDGRILVSGGENKTIIFWDITKKQLKQKIDAHQGIVYALSFSFDNGKLATGSDDKSIGIYHVEKGVEKSCTNPYTQDKNFKLFSSEFIKLASCSDDNIIDQEDIKQNRNKSKFGGFKKKII
ncbi:unnamed protein product [Paramecium pentaurelia]|uniref:Protein kinase domain-containing protein n=1 Tax=Paramecium pentaurelia TaxID=43138 RepID=A0A8S1SNG8_9CILI|nr:unnamed protein product [Paramecium pentaurelia]